MNGGIVEIVNTFCSEDRVAADDVVCAFNLDERLCFGQFHRLGLLVSGVELQMVGDDRVASLAVGQRVAYNGILGILPVVDFKAFTEAQGQSLERTCRLMNRQVQRTDGVHTETLTRVVVQTFLHDLSYGRGIPNIRQVVITNRVIDGFVSLCLHERKLELYHTVATIHR